MHLLDLKSDFIFRTVFTRLIKESSRYRHRFSIIEKDNPDIVLTEKLDMTFLELPKFTKGLLEAGNGLELWLYVMKHSQSLTEEAMKILVEKKRVMEETLEELGKLSLDPAIFSAEEYRRKALSDYNSLMADSYHEGIAEGKAEGMAEGEIRGEARGKAEIAKKLLVEGYKIAEISRLTGLSEEELRKLI